MPHTLFTSESVTEGHPDKVCDQISDAILDAVLEQDPHGRVAAEVFATAGRIHIGGEVSTIAQVDYERIARRVLRDIGYTTEDSGINPDRCAVQVSVVEQSPDIAQGVDRSSIDDQGAGDQGMMFGYACNETPSLMPLPISIAHRLAWTLADVRSMHPEFGFLPDGKTQATVEYGADGRPLRVTDVIVSTQHLASVDEAEVRENVARHVVMPVIGNLDLATNNTTVLQVNPTGRFVRGGPAADAGLTGRKIIVDTYGGMARHGGGAFSGKDPSKVDRSAAYAMRWVAKNIVAASLADRCEVQVAYAIGQANPVSLRVDTFGTESVDPERIVAAVREVFDLRPGHIIRDLGLIEVEYAFTSVYGHFGREGVPWERTDRVTDLLNAI